MVMRRNILAMLGVLLLMLSGCPTPAPAACVLSYCKDGAQMRTHITNTHRQKVGDLYTPVSGQRTQIRDMSRRIIGYIERDGTVTNTHRQKIGKTNE